MAKYPRKRSTKTTGRKQPIDEGSKIVKRLASKQKIRVRLSPSQMKAIHSQLERWNNRRPAEITFLVKGQAKTMFRVAAYTYSGDTCCV
jgi:hypothetical protein